MTEQAQPYPQHIYDQNRIDLAQTILEKELRKLFLGLPEKAWQAIDHSIRGWGEAPIDYHLENERPRDFWDSFAAVMESIKLKPNFTAWITAENVSWHRSTLSVRETQMTSPLEQLQKVPGLKLRNDLPFAELADALATHPNALEEQKRLVDEHSTDPVQDVYPVIVRETKEGLFKVMDGNRRTLRAIIYGQEKIEAWVGKIDGTEPINFWVPLNDMLQLVKVFKEAVENGDEHLQQAITQVLKARFKASTVAERAYQNRIGNQTEIAKYLFELTQQS